MCISLCIFAEFACFLKAWISFNIHHIQHGNRSQSMTKSKSAMMMTMMMIRSLLLCLAFFGAVSATGGGPTFLPSSSSSKNMLQLRGGAGPLDPDMVLKAHTVLQLSQSVPLTLSPSTALDAYNLKQTATNLYLAEKVFTQELAYGLFLYALIFEGRSVESAAALSALPHLASALKSLLNGSLCKTGDWIGLILPLIMPIGVLSGADWTGKAVKILGIYQMAAGAFCALFPAESAKAWKAPVPDAAGTFLTQCLGFFALGNGVAMYLAATGSSLAKVAAYSVLTHFICVGTGTLVTKDVEKLGIDARPMLMWLAIHLTVMFSLYDK